MGWLDNGDLEVRAVRAALAVAPAGASADLAPASASGAAMCTAAVASPGFGGTETGGRTPAGLKGSAAPVLRGRPAAPACASRPPAPSGGWGGRCAAGFSTAAGRTGVTALRASAL